MVKLYLTIKADVLFIAAVASESEANERGSSSNQQKITL